MVDASTPAYNTQDDDTGTDTVAMKRILEFYAAHLHVRTRLSYLVRAAACAGALALVWLATDGLNNVPDWTLYVLLPLTFVLGLATAAFVLAVVTGPLVQSSADDVSSMDELAFGAAATSVIYRFTGRAVGSNYGLAKSGERLVSGFNGGKVTLDPANAFVGGTFVALGGLFWFLVVPRELGAGGIMLMVLMLPLLAWTGTRLRSSPADADREP